VFKVSVVQEYWTGVLQRLQAEVDVFSRLIRHQGERGRENEVALGRLLTALVPQRFGVGTGMLIDSRDSYSRQMDIIIYERVDEPTLLAQTTQLLYPVENVLACVEVKTTLYANTIDEFIRNKRSVKSLVPVQAYPSGASHPIYVVLAYKTNISPQKMNEKLMAADPEDWPDLLCVLEHGILGGIGTSLRSAPSRGLSLGLALLRDNGAQSPTQYCKVDDNSGFAHHAAVAAQSAWA
jgi:hypothetical protein